MEDQKKKDEFYMQRALDEAQAAFAAGEIPIGAVVVCKDRIISRAHNLTETLCDRDGPCRDAGHHGCRQYPWGQIPDGVHTLCDR